MNATASLPSRSLVSVAPGPGEAPAASGTAPTAPHGASAAAPALPGSAPPSGPSTGPPADGPPDAFASVLSGEVARTALAEGQTQKAPAPGAGKSSDAPSTGSRGASKSSGQAAQPLPASVTAPIRVDPATAVQAVLSGAVTTAVTAATTAPATTTGTATPAKPSPAAPGPVAPLTLAGPALGGAARSTSAVSPRTAASPGPLGLQPAASAAGATKQDPATQTDAHAPAPGQTPAATDRTAPVVDAAQPTPTPAATPAPAPTLAPVAPKSTAPTTPVSTPAPAVTSGAPAAGPAAKSGAHDAGPATPTTAPGASTPATPAAATPTPAAGTPLQAPASASAAAPASAPAPAQTPPAPYGVRLAEAAAKVSDTISLGVRDGTSVARIQLTPDSLGSIQIHLQRTADGVVARVVTQHPEAAQTLADHAEDLRQSFEQSGTTLLRLDIETSDQRGSAAEERATGSSGGFSGRRGTADEGADDLTVSAPAAVSGGGLTTSTLVNVLA